MPTPIIHLKIGYEYAKNHKEYDNKQFYLGVIAPDAVNLNGFAEKEKRWGAHIRNKELDIWKKNITEFYENNKKNFDKNYIYGYFVSIYSMHCVHAVCVETRRGHQAPGTGATDSSE